MKFETKLAKTNKMKAIGKTHSLCNTKSIESNIWKFYIARFVGRFEFIAAILVLFLLSNNLTMTQVMILQSFFTIIIFAMELPSGVIADLFGLKKTLILSQLSIVVGLVLYAFFSSFATFMIAEFFMALGWALNSGADSAFIYNTLKELKQELTFEKIMGRLNFLTVLAVGLSALLGGYLASITGYRNLFFIGGTMYFIGFLVLLSLKEPTKQVQDESKHYIKHLKEGLNLTKNNRELKKYIIYYSILSAFTFILLFFIQPYLEIKGLSLTMIGICVGGYFLFEAAGYLFTEKVSSWIKNKKLLLFILILIAISFLLLNMVSVVIGLALIFFIMFLSAIKEVVIDYEVNKLSTNKHRATILSIKNMFKNLVYVLIAPLLGYWTDKFTLEKAFLMMGIILMIFSIYIYFLFKENR